MTTTRARRHPATPDAVLLAIANELTMLAHELGIRANAYDRSMSSHASMLAHECRRGAAQLRLIRGLLMDTSVSVHHARIWRDAARAQLARIDEANQWRTA